MSPYPLALSLSAFISGAALMIAEVAGFRLLAPFLGGSIAVTSSILGVVLASLALGAWWGGRYVDQHPSPRAIANCLILAALFVFAIPFCNQWLTAWIAINLKTLEIAALLSALILFSPCSFMIGAIVPMCTRLWPRSADAVGESIGRISALSSAGSIVGTFLTGFVLLPYLGTKLSYLCAAILLVLAACIINRGSIKAAGVLLVLWLPLYYRDSARAQGSVRNFESLYAHIRVEDTWNTERTREIRTLRTDPFALQGARYIESSTQPAKQHDPFEKVYQGFEDSSETLAVPYTRFFRLGAALCNAPCKALMIGGGVFSYPKDFLHSTPDASMDVVELDSAIVRVAKQYFELAPDPRLNVIEEDGRLFLNRNSNQYNFVILDAYSSAQTIPHHLISFEALSAAKRALKPDGILMLNILSALEGNAADFLKSVRATLAELFPHVLVFGVERPAGNKIQNLVLLAGNRDFKSLESLRSTKLAYMLDHYWSGSVVPARAPVLNDDLLLVELYSREILRGMTRNYAG